MASGHFQNRGPLSRQYSLPNSMTKLMLESAVSISTLSCCNARNGLSGSYPATSTCQKSSPATITMLCSALHWSGPHPAAAVSLGSGMTLLRCRLKTRCHGSSTWTARQRCLEHSLLHLRRDDPRMPPASIGSSSEMLLHSNVLSHPLVMAQRVVSRRD